MRRLSPRTRLFLKRILALPRRAWLTVRYRGLGQFATRILTFPLRPTPLGRRLGYGPRYETAQARARDWYRRHGRPVTVVIPAYGPADTTIDTVRSVRETTDFGKVRVIVVDDGSPAEHQARLAEIEGAEVVLGEENVGFAANVNRGLRMVDEGDVVILNNDIVAHRGWLEGLQRAAWESDSSSLEEEHVNAGIVGGKLLYPDGRIQFAGTVRNLGAPEWFDHRYRFQPADHGPANVPMPVLGATGACMYVKRAVLDEIGLLDERYGMAFEDIDYCLRAWEAGFRVLYEPTAVLTHLESVTRGMVQGERELASQRAFWERWGDWLDRRDVRTADGRLRVAYVTEDTGVGGGHRDIFEHLNRLHDRGHEVALYSLGEAPDWFDLRVPVHTFEHYPALVEELAKLDAIKVATWWTTGVPVWLASVTRGIPVYFVQDIETSYYPDDPEQQDHVLATYQPEFRYMTISSYNREGLREIGLEAELMPPGVDLDTFRDVEVERRDDVVLAVGRTNPLKNLPLTVAGWRALPTPRPELWLFGIEPELGRRHGARYFTYPSDEQVNELFNTTGAFVQTSTHEGFCLPPLEAMATGAPVVCTDAHGNRDFCRDGENCLMVDFTPESVAAGLGARSATPSCAPGSRTAAGAPPPSTRGAGASTSSRRSSTRWRRRAGGGARRGLESAMARL